ncbi:MAG: hypothetical protein WD766_01045 [Gemmatimonadota bacterium]
MKLSKIAAIVLVPLAATACDEPANRPPTAEQLALRESTWRRACAAQELERLAVEEMESLDAMLQSMDPDDPLGQITRRATMAAADFARAFERHAALRSGTYAHLDSAVNVATTTADSARYIERAAAFTITPPETGSVEANVFEAYLNRLDGILEDEDHRCNWDTPFD